MDQTHSSTRRKVAPFWLGCAVWGHRGWLGDFYPPKSAPGSFLKLYGERLTAVEGNTTFWAVPDEATVERWASELPSRFRFCPKVPRYISHQSLSNKREVRRALSELSNFWQRLQPLRQQLGPFLLQLPPEFGPQKLSALGELLGNLPHPDMRICLEVRHLGWWEPAHHSALRELLARCGLGRALLDTRPQYAPPISAPGQTAPHLDSPTYVDPQEASSRKKPEVPLVVEATAPFAMVRFIGHPQPPVNEVYLQKWAEQVAQWLKQGVEVFFFAHCPNEDHSPGYARRLHHRVQAIEPGIAELPWDQLPRFPRQMNLI